MFIFCSKNMELENNDKVEEAEKQGECIAEDVSVGKKNENERNVKVILAICNNMVYKCYQNIETETENGECLDWLFDKKDTSDILTWLCTYLNENNVETCNEIQEYTNLKNEGRNLSDEYIEGRCKRNPTFEEILNINISEINSLRREVENAKIKADNLNKLTSKYLSLESKMNRNIQDEKMNSRVKRQSYLSQCVADGKQVDELHSNFYERLEQFSNILSNFNMMREKYFISQMPLNTYRQQCDIFQTNLHLWISMNFDIATFSYANEDIDNIDNTLNRLFFITQDSIIKYVQAECNQKELTAKLNYIRNSSYTEMTEEHRRMQEIQYTSRINILYNDLETLYANDLQQTAEKFAENLVNTVLIKNAEKKLNRCRDVLKTLKTLSTEIIQALAQYEMLFLLLKTDKIKIRSIDKFVDDLYFYSSNYLKNYSLRSKLMNEVENNVAKQEFAFKEIISILTETYNEEPVNIKTAITAVEKQKVAVENLENELFVIRNQKYLNEVKKVEHKIKNGKKIIWCGPTLQPVIIPYEYLQNLSITNYQIEKVRCGVKTTKENLIETRATIEKNTWLNQRRMLWVWFLMKPEKIPAVIKQLRDFVTEQDRNNT